MQHIGFYTLVMLLVTSTLHDTSIYGLYSLKKVF